VSHPGTFESVPVRGIPKSSDQDTSPHPAVKYHPAYGSHRVVAPTVLYGPCNYAKDGYKTTKDD